METKFNELMGLLNNPVKEVSLRGLFNSVTNKEKIELLATISDYLGVKLDTPQEQINNFLKQ